MAPTGRFATLARRRPLLSLVLAIAVCEVVGASGSVFTVAGLTEWYPSLTEPVGTPPNWVFAPVWTSLFALTGVACWLVWRQIPSSTGALARGALWFFAAQFVVNVAWSAVFFGLQSLLWGLLVIGLLWVFILMTMERFHVVDRRAAWLLVPYLAWVTYAAYLNYGFWALN